LHIFFLREEHWGTRGLLCGWPMQAVINLQCMADRGYSFPGSKQTH